MTFSSLSRIQREEKIDFKALMLEILIMDLVRPLRSVREARNYVGRPGVLGRMGRGSVRLGR